MKAKEGDVRRCGFLEILFFRFLRKEKPFLHVQQYIVYVHERFGRDFDEII